MISVVVPVYNVEMYLERCVDSLSKQSFSNYEIILVDDGSTDSSPEICDRLAMNHLISVYHKSNGGLSSARNYGVSRAKGEWVTFVDPDDYVSESYLEDLFNLIQKYDADMAITRIELRSEEDAKKDWPERFKDFVTDKRGGFYEVYIGDKVGWSGCGKLVKTKVLLENPFPDGFYEDSASAYRHIDKCNKIAIGDFENNYKYIRRNGSITASTLSDKHFHIFEVCEQIENYINNNISERKYYSVPIYENAVIQLLNRVKMESGDYSKIFLKYRDKFRSNALSLAIKKDISIKTKVYIFLLCTNPTIYKFVITRLLKRAINNE